jgi:hypothetical protein
LREEIDVRMLFLSEVMVDARIFREAGDHTIYA